MDCREQMPKSLLGAYCTILFYTFWFALVLYLLIWQLYGVTNNEISLGEVMRGRFNHRRCFELKLNSGDPPSSIEEPIVSLPTLQLKIDSSIKMYEKLGDIAPSMQGFEVVDNLGYTNLYGSTDILESTSDVARGKVKSLYMKSKGLLNSWDESMSINTPPRGGLHTNIQKAIARSKTHQFPSESMKSVYLQGLVFEGNNNLTNHTAHMFIRLKENQLMRIKPCQAQIWMVNSGEYEMLKKAGMLEKNEYHQLLLSRTVDSTLWKDDSFVQIYPTAARKWKYSLTAKEKLAILDNDEHLLKALPEYSINLIHLKRQYTVQDKEQFFKNARKYLGSNEVFDVYRNLPEKEKRKIDQAFSIWNFGVNYNTNFQRMIEHWECDGEQCFLQPSEGVEYVFAEPFSKNDTKIEIITTTKAKDVKEHGWSKNWANIPKWKNKKPNFYIYAFGINGEERLKVTGINEVGGISNKIVVTVQRDGNSVDFNKPTTGKIVLPDDSWVCPKSWWGSQNGCNCECGSWDPDCGDKYLDTQEGEVKGCPQDKPFCSALGRCMHVDPRFHFSDDVKRTKLEYNELYTITPRVVALTMLPYDDIKVDGEVVLDGFFGTRSMLEDEFEGKSQSQMSCAPCPNDIITGGLPLRSQENHQYYCNLRVEGFFEAFEQPSMEFETEGEKMKPLSVTINNVVGRLPACDTTGEHGPPITCKGMKMELSSYDLRNSETFDVLKVVSLNNHQQQMLLKFDGKLQTTLKYHLSAGKLLTSISSNSELIYVDTLSQEAGIMSNKFGCNGYKCPDNERQFNKNGPYLVDVDGLGSLLIAEAYRLYKGPYWDVQILKLAKQPSFSIGISSYFTTSKNQEGANIHSNLKMLSVYNAGFFGAMFGRGNTFTAGIQMQGELNSTLGVQISKVTGPTQLGRNILRVIFPLPDMPWKLIRKLEGKSIYGEKSGANGTIAFAGRSFRTGENIFILYNVSKDKSFEPEELLIQGNGENVLGNTEEITVGMNLYKMSFIAPVTINYGNNTQDCLSQMDSDNTKFGTLEILHEKVKHGDVQVKTIYFSAPVEFQKERDVYYNGRNLGVAQNIILFSEFQKSASPWECPNAYFNDVSINLGLMNQISFTNFE